MDDHVHVLERVLAISRSMAQTRQLGPLLDYAMREAVDLVGAQRGFLVLVDDDGSLDFRVGLNRAGEAIEKDQISTSILSEVVETGRPVVLADALSHGQFSAAESVVNLKLRSVMGVPLITKGDAIGAILVENRLAAGIFTQESLAPLILFANQAAVSIENAMLVEELETRVRARTAELADANARLQALNAEKDRFIAIAAHDLRGPLSNIEMTGRLLLDVRAELPAEQVRFLLSDVLEQTEYMLALLNNLLDVSRIESGELELELKSVEMADMLAETVERHDRLAVSKDIQVVLSPVPEGAALADRNRLRQVLDNLISNAVKYSPRGTTVHVEADLTDGQWLIRVIDEGPGIDPVEQARLFRYFERLSTAPTGGEKSTGLGLAIAREIVRAHGGEIGVESEPGAGAMFWFTLPVADG
jgi:signal transduction histidine kinase